MVTNNSEKDFVVGTLVRLIPRGNLGRPRTTDDEARDGAGLGQSSGSLFMNPMMEDMTRLHEDKIFMVSQIRFANNGEYIMLANSPQSNPPDRTLPTDEAMREWTWAWNWLTLVDEDDEYLALAIVENAKEKELKLWDGSVAMVTSLSRPQTTLCGKCVFELTAPSRHEGQYAMSDDTMVAMMRGVDGGYARTSVIVLMSEWEDSTFRIELANGQDWFLPGCEDDLVELHSDSNYEGLAHNSGSVYCEERDGYFLDSEVGDNVFYSERNGRYQAYEDRDRVTEYHEGIRETKREAEDCDFTIGFEVEKEDEGPLDRFEIHECESHGWAREHDGSLDDDEGFELVSPVFDLFGDSLEKDLKQVVIREHVNASFNNSTCGGHINVGARGKSGRQFFNEIQAYLPLLLSLYRNRLGNTYSKIQKDKASYENAGKYSAVSVKRDYVEFRMPSAVRNCEQLIWRRDLIRIMCSNLMARPINVLGDITNSRSPLHKHLLKVLTQEQILRVASVYAQFADDYYNTYTVTKNGEGVFFKTLLNTFKRKKISALVVVQFSDGFEILNNEFSEHDKISHSIKMLMEYK